VVVLHPFSEFLPNKCERLALKKDNSDSKLSFKPFSVIVWPGEMQYKIKITSIWNYVVHCFHLQSIAETPPLSIAMQSAGYTVELPG
jgi:hypothetical protein